MKLLFPLALALVMGGCSQPAEPQSGTGSSVAGNSTTADTTTTGTTTPPAEQTLVRPAHVDPAPPDPTPIKDRKPKDGEEVALMETSLGSIVLMFFPDKAPNHVASFKYLASKGFYDGIKFHRIIPNFMIQVGDPNTKNGDPSTWGSGGPGYKVDAEFNDVKHVPGILSMARQGDEGERTGAMPGPEAANSAGSQFFIMVAPYPSLDKRYSVFGKVATGMDTVEKLRTVQTGPGDRPVDPPVIKSLKIVKWPIK